MNTEFQNAVAAVIEIVHLNWKQHYQAFKHPFTKIRAKIRAVFPKN